MNWLDFTPPRDITLEIVPIASVEDGDSEVGLLSKNSQYIFNIWSI